MSDREIRQESPTHASGAVRVAIALSLVAALGTVSAMFPSYFKGDYALVDTGGTLLFNAPGILLLFESAVLLTSARTRTFGAGLLTGFVAIWSWEHMSDLGQVVSYGKEPGLGWILGLSSWGVMIVAAVFSVVALYQDKDSAGFAPDGRRPFHLVAAGGISAVFVIGWVLPFTTTTYVANAPNWTFDATGSNVISTSCCSLSQILDQSGWQAVDTLGTLVMVPLVIHLAVLMRRPLLQSGLLAGVAVALMGTAGFALNKVFSRVDLMEIGYSAAKVRERQLTADTSLAGGLILHLLAITAIIGLAIWLWPRPLKSGD